MRTRKGYVSEDIIMALERVCKVRMLAYSNVQRIKRLIIRAH
jgi:hypothetical protein